MSLNQLIYSVFQIIGAAVIPSDEIHAKGNFGTVATCTTQGFFFYVCYSLSLFYYTSFTVYSFVGILCNFEKEKYVWVEKYIHAVVPIYPLVTAFVILSEEGFNAKYLGGYCTAYSTPWYCGDPNYGDYPCERGPSNSGIYFILYIVSSQSFFLLLSWFSFVSKSSNNNHKSS